MKKGIKRDLRIKARHFSWKEFLLAYLVLSVLSAGQGMIYDEYLDTGQLPAEYIFGMAGYWALVSAAFTLITHFQMRKKFDEPMQLLGSAAQRVADGDFSVFLEPLHTADKQDYIDVMFEDFNKMVEELGSIETLKNDFIANVSHEMKTPLSIIRNYASALKKANLSSDEREEYISTIIGAADNLTALVTNILKLSQLENSEILPATEPYDLCRQLSDIVIALEKSLEDKDIELEVRLDERLMICYDPGVLELVWHNLLSNAVKFTPSGGKITLSQSVAANTVTISVSDTGCGMDSETIKHIFDKFYQGDLSRSGSGNGLGLSLVRRVLELVGGEITVVSAPDAGTTFTVTLAVR